MTTKNIHAPTVNALVAGASHVIVHYTNTTSAPFKDWIDLDAQGRATEAYDYSTGEKGPPMSVKYPDFKFQGWSVARFVKETINHASHPDVIEVTIEAKGMKTAVPVT